MQQFVAIETTIVSGRVRLRSKPSFAVAVVIIARMRYGQQELNTGVGSLDLWHLQGGIACLQSSGYGQTRKGYSPFLVVWFILSGSSLSQQEYSIFSGSSLSVAGILRLQWVQSVCSRQRYYTSYIDLYICRQTRIVSQSNIVDKIKLLNSKGYFLL